MSEQQPDNDDELTDFILETLRVMVRKGYAELVRNGKLHGHTKTLTDAVQKVRVEPEVEVRLTFDTLNIAACMFNAAYQQLERDGLVDLKKTDFPNIELTNGSALIVLSDEEITADPGQAETLVHEVMSNRSRPS